MSWNKPMKNLAIKTIAVLVVLFAIPSLALAGAWCMKQGALYSKLSYNQYFTVDTYDKHGDKHRNPDGSNFHDHNFSWYAEYGLRDHLTTFASLPYKQLRSHYRFREDDQLKHTTSSYNGLGDLELGLKYCFLEKPVVLSGQVLAKVAWFYDGHEKVPPGNNQNDYEIKVLAGRSLWPFPGYCGAELGYRWRTNDPSDEYRYLLEFGMNFTKKLSGRLKLDGIKSVKNARLPKKPAPQTDAYVDYETGRVVKTTYDPADSTAGFTNPSLGIEYDLAKLELTLGYQCTQRWSIECTYTGYPYGENIAAGDQYSLALVYFFSR
jgi:hypothetical protein